MVKIREEILYKWRGLPEWMRREMRRGCRVGWVYSGMEEVGWSWSGSIGGVGFEEDLLKEGEETEITPSEPMYYMEYIRGLTGGDIKFRSERRDEVLWIGVYVDGDWIWGYGVDREEAFLELVRGIGEWYWMEKCPGLGDISRGKIFDNYNGDEVEFEIEVNEVNDGMEVMFSDFFAARMFMGKWDRFILSPGIGAVGNRFYHGRMQMVEGEIEIYSRLPDMTGGYGRNNYVATAYGVGGYGVSSSMGGMQVNLPSFNVTGNNYNVGVDSMGDNDPWYSKEYKDLVDMIKDKNYSGYKN
jgi:hypothetical protein